jgi:GNAT superfamily N-acetyltransferase
MGGPETPILRRSGPVDLDPERRPRMPITIHELPQGDLTRLAEIDRTEHVKVGYECRDGVLTSGPVDWRVPRWNPDPAHSFSVAAHIRAAAPVFAAGAVLLGAFDGAALVGLGILRHRLTGETAQLAFLQVDRGHRRGGIGARLAAEMIRRARESGARALYVSATPSESAVGFYLSLGFRPTTEVDRELFELEPEDIHMTRPL